MIRVIEMVILVSCILVSGWAVVAATMSVVNENKKNKTERKG